MKDKRKDFLIKSLQYYRGKSKVDQRFIKAQMSASIERSDLFRRAAGLPRRREVSFPELFLRIVTSKKFK